MIYRCFFSLFVLITPLLISVTSPASAQDDLTPKAYVQNLGDALTTIFNTETSPKHRAERFQKVFFAATDVQRFGLFALGRYARRLNREQKQVYFSLLRDFLTEIYIARFSNYTFSGQERLEILSSRFKTNKKNEFIVSSRLFHSLGKKPIPIIWWGFRDDNRWRIFDLQIAGIWLAQEQRSQFSAIIARNGGNVDALLDHLRDKINSFNEP